MDIRDLGRVAYLPTWQAMREFTADRGESTPDELWLCEHEPVFTQGVAGKPEHLLDAGDIPVVQTDRGGQVSYHGPGQVVAYPLIDLRPLGIYVREYVFRIEESVIRALALFGVTGHRVSGAPGIYVQLHDPSGHSRPPKTASFVGLGKIAALGIKVSRHCTYHGVALNVAMEMEPFRRIEACGHPGLETVDLSTIGVSTTWNEAAAVLSEKLNTFLAP